MRVILADITNGNRVLGYLIRETSCFATYSTPDGKVTINKKNKREVNNGYWREVGRIV